MPAPASAILILAAFLALACTAWSQSSGGYCHGTITQKVPAVVGNGAGLVNVSISFLPAAGAAGKTYAAVSPRLGLNTQESIDQAISYAYAASGDGMACDVLVSFDSSNSGTAYDYIEGPSAGAALSVMTYALLHNRTMRNDTIITGTVEDSGAIGPVGGLYEKSKSAAMGGASYFIAPAEGIYETLILRNVEDRYGIRILEARNVSEVISFMLDNVSIRQEGIASEKSAMPEAAPYDASGIGAFRPVAAGMVALENGTLASVSGNDNDSAAVRDYFGNEVLRQDKLLKLGYLFSAANEAFLDYIDIFTVKAIISGDSDIPRMKGTLGKCLTSLKRPALTDRDFELVVGADLRQAWAYDRLNNATDDSQMLEDERYLEINKLGYGSAWCQVAKSLLSAAPSGADGAAIDESAWKALALDKINEARGLAPQKEDSISRLDIAQKSYGDGRYGAAIYDAVYVINNEERLPAGQELENSTATLMNETRQYLWARIYQSHAAFLYSQNMTEAAYSTARFAKELDEATAMMAAKAANASAAGAAWQTAGEGEHATPSAEGSQAQQQGQDLVPAPLALIAAGLSIFLLVVAVIALAMALRKPRRADGNDGQGTRRAHGAEQKKGRARIQEGSVGRAMRRRAQESREGS
jgi:uncharacterized protein